MNLHHVPGPVHPIRITVGALVVAALLASPAAGYADQDPTGPPPDIGAARNDIGAGTSSSPSGQVDVRRLLNDIDTPIAPVASAADVTAPTPAPPAAGIRPADSAGWDLGELAVGALLGAAATVGGVLIVRRRGPHPA